MAKIRIRAATVEMTATLNESESAKKLLTILPVKIAGNVWGREIYFSIPMDMPEEDAQATVPSGTIAFWPPGSAFCIFFGQTPASPVNLLGTLDGDASEFADVPNGEMICIEAAE